MYGNNALLGVINVVTRRGRDIDGLQVAGTLGDWRQRTWRVSAGQRHANGLEWLASFTGHADTSLPTTQIGDLFDRSIGHSQNVLLKAQWEGFSALLLTAQRHVATDYRDQPEQAWYTTYLDRSELLALGHDSRPSADWRLSVKAQAGRYDYRYHDDDNLWGHYRTTNEGRWWALDTQAGYEGWAGHKLVLGARLRRDPVQHFHDVGYEGEVTHFAIGRRSMGFSAEDQFTVNDQWSLTAGVRADRRDALPWTWSPRLAAVWQPDPAWSLKASHGRATRFRSAADTPQPLSEDEVFAAPQDEAVTATTSELVSEYRAGNLRLLGSLYQFDLRNRLGTEGEVQTSRGQGAELEAEWQWRGWRVRGSQSWQDAEAGDLPTLPYAPTHLTKLQVSAPLDGEALRLSATLRRTGEFSNYVGPVPSRNLLDLTLVSQKALAGLDLRIGWRNVLQRRDKAIDEYYYEPPLGAATRHAWIELSGTFR
jgi:outer membrane receptor protein involved in Fe transport